MIRQFSEQLQKTPTFHKKELEKMPLFTLRKERLPCHVHFETDERLQGGLNLKCSSSTLL